MISLDLIARWPGKSAGENGIEHPAIYHMSDVAAVAEILLQQTDFSAEHRTAMTLLSALHDIGKLHGRFRDMLRGGIVNLSAFIAANAGPPDLKLPSALRALPTCWHILVRLAFCHTSSGRDAAPEGLLFPP